MWVQTLTSFGVVQTSINAEWNILQTQLLSQHDTAQVHKISSVRKRQQHRGQWCKHSFTGESMYKTSGRWSRASCSHEKQSKMTQKYIYMCQSCFDFQPGCFRNVLVLLCATTRLAACLIISSPHLLCLLTTGKHTGMCKQARNFATLIGVTRLQRRLLTAMQTKRDGAALWQEVYSVRFTRSIR